MPQSHTLYRCYSVNQQLLYIGVSVRGLSRMMQHRGFADWYAQIAFATFEHYPDKRTALDAERTAIEREQPSHNREYVITKRPSGKLRYKQRVANTRRQRLAVMRGEKLGVPHRFSCKCM